MMISPEGDRAVIVLDPGNRSITLYDGGNPGTTKDSFSFTGGGTCGHLFMSLTDGNINIKGTE
jgi:hypothetical protein